MAEFKLVDFFNTIGEWKNLNINKGDFSYSTIEKNRIINEEINKHKYRMTIDVMDAFKNRIEAIGIDMENKERQILNNYITDKKGHVKLYNFLINNRKNNIENDKLNDNILIGKDVITEDNEIKNEVQIFYNNMNISIHSENRSKDVVQNGINGEIKKKIIKVPGGEENTSAIQNTIENTIWFKHIKDKISEEEIQKVKNHAKENGKTKNAIIFDFYLHLMEAFHNKSDSNSHSGGKRRKRRSGKKGKKTKKRVVGRKMKRKSRRRMRRKKRNTRKGRKGSRRR